MEEKRIQFHTAKLAAQKGFVSGSIKGYTGDGKLESPHFGNLFKNTDHDNSVIYEAPTQSQLQTWLRDNEKIHVSIDLLDNSFEKFGYTIQNIWREYLNTISEDVKEPYEETLEKALFEALKSI